MHSLTVEGQRRLVFLKATLERAQRLIRSEGDLSTDRTTCVLLLDYVSQGLMYLTIAEIGTPTSFPEPESGYIMKIATLKNQNAQGFVDFRFLCDYVTSILRTNTKSTQVPYLTEIRRLHQARNDTQHSFSIPSTSDLERFHNYVRAMAEQLLQDLFNIRLDAIGFSLLVRDKVLKKRLQLAESSALAEDFISALDHCAVAVEETLRRRAWTFPIHQFKDLPTNRISPSREDLHPSKDGSFLFTWLQFVAIGINQKDAERFYFMTPFISVTASGIPCVTGCRTDLNRNDVEFALQFSSTVISRLEDIGIADFYPTGEWFASDERRYLERKIGNWDPHREGAVPEAYSLLKDN